MNIQGNKGSQSVILCYHFYYILNFIHEVVEDYKIKTAGRKRLFLS